MIQTINTNGDDDAPVPKQITSTTGAAFRDVGHDVDLIGMCEVPAHSDLDTGKGRTPRFMTDGTDTAEMVRTGTAFPFSVEERIEGYFGESSGSSNVTTFFVRESLAIDDVVRDLEMTGQIEAACRKVAPFLADDVRPIDVVAYAVATYAKGWMAERLLVEETDRFSKGSVSQDQGGLDVFDRQVDDWRQVKSVTVDDRVDGWLYYQWDMRGGLHVGDTLKDVNASACSVAGVPKTTAYRCHSAYTDGEGQTYRYIWW